MNAGNAAYDQANPAPGQFLIKMDLLFRNMTGFIRASVIGGGADKTVSKL
jgi:hypothetical protein